MNATIDTLAKRDQAIEAKLATYREVDKLETELALCKAALASGVSTSAVAPTAIIDTPIPKAYGEARNARKIDNFLWNVERYFEVV